MEKLINLSNNPQGLEELKNKLVTSGGQSPDSGSLFMGLSMWGIFLGFIFSMVGLAFFRIGKKDRDMKYMVLGVILMVYPYFVTNTIYIILIGLFLSFIPLIFKRFF